MLVEAGFQEVDLGAIDQRQAVGIDHDMDAAVKVLNAIDKITSNIEVVVTVSADAADLPEELKKFVI